LSEFHRVLPDASEDFERARRLTGLARDTPELMIDRSVLESNIATRARAARDAGVALRPHTKTHKMPEISHIQLEAGAAGIQVAKLGEGEVMAASGIDDILIGLQIVGRPKLERLIELAADRSITVTLDSMDVAEPLARAARAHGLALKAMVEIDTGLARTGVQPGRPAVRLAQKIAALEGLELAGVMTHEGHICSRTRTPAERAPWVREACDAVVETAGAIRELGIRAPVASVGASATFAMAIKCPGITEVRPGTYVFNDATQVAHAAATTRELAAFVIATVVSCTRLGEFVVDAGTKALTSDRMLVPDAPSTFGHVFGTDWRVVRCSEEHGVVSTGSSATLRVGDRVAIVPNHICPVVNLFDRATIVRGDNIVAEWNVAARGRIQ
jgi:D-serine deaminase-like pyridoxal phosphate-dependent protein